MREKRRKGESLLNFLNALECKHHLNDLLSEITIEL